MQAKKIICRQCGAVIPPGTAACPYCGSAYAPEAEREYMRKLHRIKEELEDVGDAGKHASNIEISRSGKRTAVIVGFILAAGAALFLFFSISRNRENLNNRNEYAWRQEHLQELDRLFDEGEYDSLITAFETARDEGHDLYDWDHYEFCTFWEEAEYIDHCLEARDAGYFSKEDAEELLYQELRIRGFRKRRAVPAEDQKIMAARAEQYQNDLEDIFHVSAEDLETFDAMLAKNGGFPEYKACSKYVEDHPDIIISEQHTD